MVLQMVAGGGGSSVNALLNEMIDGSASEMPHHSALRDHFDYFEEFAFPKDEERGASLGGTWRRW
jgi:hypothetical protein